MAFGQPGRPPEDRVARRRAIYVAVAPLLERVGVRGLSMRGAARAAGMSVGGLYHYFPTKRDLVLFPFDPEHDARVCAEFETEHGHLAATDRAAYVRAGIRLLVDQAFLTRPSLRAAVELGPDTLADLVERTVAHGVCHFELALVRLQPDAPVEARDALARAVRRTLVAAQLDPSASPAELADDLAAVLTGHLARLRRQALAPA